MVEYKTNFSKQFIAATTERSELNHSVPAPYFRKKITVEKPIKNAICTICGLGFYRFWLNGQERTKGFLSPYITNPDKILDYDKYELTSELKQGDNVLAFQLGNGMQNSFGGFVWDFDKAAFRSAPKMAVCLQIEYVDGCVERYEGDESFLCAPSPVLRDDLRFGEMYDANFEIDGWNEVDFDDSAWHKAIKAECPQGEVVLCEANAIQELQQLKPISIKYGKWVPGTSKDHHYGYIYDFGLNTTGIVKLKIQAHKGQRITLTFGELLDGEDFYTDNISFVRPDTANYPDYVQHDIYIAKGFGIEEYEPSFTYHGFRYVFVEGITEEQATSELLTYKVMATKLEEVGDFSCSCDTLNALQKMTRNAVISNFWHIPTDCPHREKNGWTADIALSAEHILLNLDPYHNLYEWMRHVRKAMNEKGALPGIVPTAGWGFHWGNGPAWDQVIVELPYQMYRYYGDKKIVEENIVAIMRYVKYLETRRDEKGLVAFGLGDWCAPVPPDQVTPLIVTDSIISMTIFQKAALLSRICGNVEDAEYCEQVAADLKECIRKNLIDLETCIVRGETQTAQAMAIYYDVLTGNEKEKALQVLLSYLEKENWHLNTGVLGARVMFHVLADYGYADLAYDVITVPTAHSYGYWVKQGYTALAEDFTPEEKFIQSKNHHFFGDISAFFIKDICGIHYNPNLNDLSYVEIKPNFIDKLDYAKAYHETPKGKIKVEWQRKTETVELKISLPKEMKYDFCISQKYKEEKRENGSWLEIVATIENQ